MSTEAKKDYLRRWLQMHTTATIEQSRQAVKARFGESLGTRHLNMIMQEFRRAGVPARPYLAPTPVSLPAIRPPPQTKPRKLVSEITRIAELSESEALEPQAVASVCGAAMVAAGIQRVEIVNNQIVVVLVKKL